MITDIDTWRDNLIETANITWKKKYEKIKRHKDTVLQHEFTDDSKRTKRKITVDQSPMCGYPLDEVDRFLRGRLEQNPVFHAEYVNDFFPIKKFFDGERNDILLHDLTDKEKMIHS
jgi:hypothetical protein